MRTITVNGIDYQIEFGLNAVCALEDELNRSVTEIGASLVKGSARMATHRAILWAGLLASKRGITISAAGDILDAAGEDYLAVMNEVSEELATSLTQKLAPASATEPEKKM